MVLSKQKYTTEVFGQRLKELCQARGPYSEIARDLDINRQQFARYINGTSMPRDALVKKIADYFEIDAGLLFQTSDQLPSNTDNATGLALMKMMGDVQQEPISEQELPSGLYMQYKQSFTQSERIVCMLSRIFRDAAGVARCRRRYSIKVISDLPGVKASHVSNGIFFKTLGALIFFDIDGVAGDLVLSAYKPSSVFSISDNVKTGVLMTHGRPGNLGPVAGRMVLELLPEGQSALKWARQQGFKEVEELPAHIQYHMNGSSTLPPNVMAIR